MFEVFDGSSLSQRFSEKIPLNNLWQNFCYDI